MPKNAPAWFPSSPHFSGHACSRLWCSGILESKMPSPNIHRRRNAPKSCFLNVGQWADLFYSRSLLHSECWQLEKLCLVSHTPKMERPLSVNFKWQVWHICRGSSSNPYGNWAPYVAGTNVDASGSESIQSWTECFVLTLTSNIYQARMESDLPGTNMSIQNENAKLWGWDSMPEWWL